MKKYILFGMIVSMLLLQACVSPANRRQTYVNDNPNLSPDLAASILKGQIAKGMDVKDVRAAWGTPDRESFSISEGENQQWNWSYYTPIGRFMEGTVILTFLNGKLINLVN